MNHALSHGDPMILVMECIVTSNRVHYELWSRKQLFYWEWMCVILLLDSEKSAFLLCYSILAFYVILFEIMFDVWSLIRNRVYGKIVRHLHIERETITLSLCLLMINVLRNTSMSTLIRSIGSTYSLNWSEIATRSAKIFLSVLTTSLIIDISANNRERKCLVTPIRSTKGF